MPVFAAVKRVRCGTQLFILTLGQHRNVCLQACAFTKAWEMMGGGSGPGWRSRSRDALQHARNHDVPEEQLRQLEERAAAVAAAARADSVLGEQVHGTQSRAVSQQVRRNSCKYVPYGDD